MYISAEHRTLVIVTCRTTVMLVRHETSPTAVTIIDVAPFRGHAKLRESQ